MPNNSTSKNTNNKNDLEPLTKLHLTVFGGTSGIGLALALHHLKLGVLTRVWPCIILMRSGATNRSSHMIALIWC